MKKNKLTKLEETLWNDIKNMESYVSMKYFGKPVNALQIAEIAELNEIIYNMNHPTWKPIYINNEKTKYEVSNCGSIRNTQTGKILTVRKNGNSYLTINLCHKGKTYSKLVHKLVAIAFIPNPENKPEVNHKDGDKTNTYWWNLSWVTKSENIRHAFDTGLIKIKYGEESSNVKFTEAQIRKVCELLEQGNHPRFISRELGVPESLPSSIKRHVTWTQISKDYKIPKPGEIPKGPRITPKTSKIYSKQTILKVCKLLEKNQMRSTDIAKKLNVSTDLVYDIKGKRSWTLYSKDFNIPPRNTPLNPINEKQ